MNEIEKPVQYGPFVTMTVSLEPPEELSKDYADPYELLGRRLAKRLDVMIAEIAVKFSDEKCAKCRKHKRGKCSGPLMTPCRKSRRAVGKGLKKKLKEAANNETD